MHLWRSNSQPFEDAPGDFPGELTIIRKPDTPLEIIVGPLTSEKRAPRTPPKPEVDVDGNVLEPKKRIPPKSKAVQDNSSPTFLNTLLPLQLELVTCSASPWDG
ncbi:hypothetical protein MMC14_005065 [Varicellaria rhodocarpa]|nr:hypothetical protein [Varicellaria rhodocarpa]